MNRIETDNFFGLLQNDLNSIIAVITQYPEVTEAVFFGSRVKGIYRTGSDVDIALKGKKMNAEIITKISYQLNEETTMPYKFDILNYNTIRNSDLAAHINRLGICFFPDLKK